MKVVFVGIVIVEVDESDFVCIEGNWYFLLVFIVLDMFVESFMLYICLWKGEV